MLRRIAALNFNKFRRRPSPILLIIFNQPATVEMEMEHKKHKKHKEEE